MRAAQLYGPEDLRVETTDEQDLEPGTIRVDLGYTGICGSDVHEYRIGPVPIRAEDTDHDIPRSEWDEWLPKPMGHEMAGTVSAVGNGVEAVDIGDRVAPNILLSCGECQYCRAGKPNLCTAIDGNPVTVQGYADSIVFPASGAVPIPDDLPLRHAALTEPLSVSVHAVRRSGLEVGDTVAVFGAGPIGLGIVDAARAAGAGRILVSEPREARREAAGDLGAAVTIDPTETDPVESLTDETDGVDVSFEVAGVEATLTQALRSTKYDGTVVVVSVFEETAELHPNDVMQAERTVVGSFGYTDEFQTTLGLMADGRLSPERFITDTVSLDTVERAFEDLLDPDSDQIKVLVEP